MKFISNILGLMAVFCIFDGANAALRAGGATGDALTPRVSAIPTSSTLGAMRRLPTMVSAKNVSTSTSTSTTTTSSSALMDMTECVEKYTECIKDPDVCGFDFEECTTSELFYAKKPQCNSVLLQCSANGINALFGTSSTTNLATKNANDEYVYPTAGSILGQFIEAGAINNRLDKSSCVKRYTSCLKKESVCGETFELCTSNNEFKKQKIYCESTLARCMDDGKTELFGSTNIDSNPTTASRLGIMIKEGADLASVNAVSTCYKVADQCILSTCKANPYKCIVDSSTGVVNITQAIVDGMSLTSDQATALSDILTTTNVNSFIRGACKDTIGGNKYCHMTVNGGKVPTASQLIDEDERDNVYSDVYASRMNAVMRSKVQDFANEFDKKTKDKCVETVMACAMRSCGSGLGSLCYKKVFGAGANTSDFTNSINGANTYAEIQNGCAAIVNTDANCQYAAAVSNATTGGYTYAYNDSNVFGIVFPTAGGSDVLGAVEKLNAALADNYNDAAIAKLAKDCRNTAISCIKSMCGSDYTNCYRNRTDIMSDTYDTGNAVFDHSMNKVGGVLDFNIIRGLCVETVKNASTCDEHLKINSVRYMSADKGADGWGTNDVRTAWNDAVKSGYKQSNSYDVEVLVGCMVGSSSTSEKCKTKQNNPNLVEDCGYMDEDGCLYDAEYRITETDYAFSMASDTLFQEVLGDIEKEAQAKYNAKLTAEQNMCIAANNGGLMGARDMSGTYMWVKLKSKRIPKNYSTAGLKVNDFVASNDLYGSFCRARVTIQSDDPDIQSVLQNGKNWSTAYFAVGDVFTCGSWIDQKDLESIANAVACKKAKINGTLSRNADCSSKDVVNQVGLTTGQKWATAAAVIGGGALGGVGMDLLQTKTGLGGLLGTQKNTSSDKNKLNASKSQAERYFIDYCSSNGDDYTNNCFYRSFSGSVANGGFSLEEFTLKDGTHCKDNTTVSGANASCKELKGYIDRVEKQLVYGDDDETWWNKGNNGRLVVDAVGTVALGTVGGLAVGKNIKASNIQKFTADQQEFMNEVGSHIYCFIGADEAGTYGDLIEISVD